MPLPDTFEELQTLVLTEMRRLDNSLQGKLRIYNALYELEVYIPTLTTITGNDDFTKEKRKNLYPGFLRALFSSDDVRHLLYLDPKVRKNLKALSSMFRVP